MFRLSQTIQESKNTSFWLVQIHLVLLLKTLLPAIVIEWHMEDSLFVLQ